MRLPLSRAVRMCFDPQAVIPFLVASICLSVLANAVYELLRSHAGPVWLRHPVVIALGAVAVLGAAVVWLSVWLSREAHELEDISDGNPSPRRGLILLVSRSEMCEAAIGFHLPTLERVWLICSTASKPVADELVKKFAAIQFTVLDPVVEVENPQPFFRAVRAVYRDQLPDGWTSDDIISDCTGMTKTASIGMVMACIGRERPVQYTRATFDGPDKRIGTLSPVELRFDWTGISRTPPAVDVNSPEASS